MKAERRHELQENVLAGWLTRQIEAIKPYWQSILALVILVVIVFLLWNMFSSRSSAKKSAGWSVYFQAAETNDAGELEKVAADFPESTAGAWALQAAADMQLVSGTNQVFSSSALARENLDKAIDNYLAVLKRAEKLEQDMLTRRALFGLARARESTFETSKAQDRYQELVDNFPESAEAEAARGRLKNLKKTATKEFLAWLPKQDLSPKPMPRLPETGPGGPGGPGRPGGLGPRDTLPGLPSPMDPSGFGTGGPGGAGDRLKLGDFIRPDGNTPPGTTTDSDSPDGAADDGDASTTEPSTGTTEPTPTPPSDADRGGELSLTPPAQDGEETAEPETSSDAP